MTYWGAPADMLLTTGWAYGVLARDIAQAISILTGHPVSRNACIGRADRIGLPQHPLFNRQPAPPPRCPAAPAMQQRASA